MDENKEAAKTAVRNHLKVLLLHLAAKSDNPGSDLQILLKEVIEELHHEVKQTLVKKPHLRLI